MKKFLKMLCAALICATVFNGCSKNSDDKSIVKDADGNVYNTVTIGTQVWMVENLKTTKYRNGDAISGNSEDYEGMYYNYDNVANVNKYGRLYNWYAVKDSRNIAPKGWHVPTNSEWTTLSTYISTHLGTSGSEAKALAAATDWLPSTELNAIGNDLMKNNSSGFTARPGGMLNFGNSFFRVGEIGYWWSSSEYDSDHAWSRFLTENSKVMDNSDYVGSAYKDYCYSVRCVKD